MIMIKKLNFYIIYIISLFCIMLCLLSNLSYSNNTKTNSIKVKAGIYVTHIINLNDKNKEADLAFWAWFIFPNDRVDPSIDFTNAAENVKILSKQKSILPDGKVKYIYKFQGTFEQDWDFYKFPKDKESISIKIESMNYNTDQMVFEIIQKKSYIDNDIKLPGWIIGNNTFKATYKKYNSAFSGDDTINNNTNNKIDNKIDKTEEYSYFSTAEFNLDLTRNNIRLIFQIYGMLQLSILLTLCVFLLTNKDVRSRIALISASVFAVVGSEITTFKLLPPSAYLQRIDILQITYIIMLCATLILTSINSRVAKHNKKLASTINKVGGITYSIIALGLMYWTYFT